MEFGKKLKRNLEKNKQNEFHRALRVIRELLIFWHCNVFVFNKLSQAKQKQYIWAHMILLHFMAKHCTLLLQILGRTGALSTDTLWCSLAVLAKWIF